MNLNKKEISKYLDFIDWLWDRFSVNGEVLLSVENEPSAYSRLESAYFKKHFSKEGLE